MAQADDPFGGKSNIYVALHTWSFWSLYVATQQAMRPPLFRPPFAATGASLEQIQREYGAFLIAVHLSMIPDLFAGISIEKADLDARILFVLLWVQEFTHSFGPDCDLVRTERGTLSTALNITGAGTLEAAEKRFIDLVSKYRGALERSTLAASGLLWCELRQNPTEPMPDEFADFIGRMSDGVRGGVLEVQERVGFDYH